MHGCAHHACAASPTFVSSSLQDISSLKKKHNLLKREKLRLLKKMGQVRDVGSREGNMRGQERVVRIKGNAESMFTHIQTHKSTIPRRKLGRGMLLIRKTHGHPPRDICLEKPVPSEVNRGSFTLTLNCDVEWATSNCPAQGRSKKTPDYCAGSG